jgi:hypothetical protein
MGVLLGLAGGLMLARQPAMENVRHGGSGARAAARNLAVEQLGHDAATRTYERSFVATNGMRVILTSPAQEAKQPEADDAQDRLSRFVTRDRMAR